MKNICIILFLSCFALQGLAQVAVDVKGTKFVVDSSKWKLSGANIFIKNAGNTGIGTSAPAFKLDIHAAANPLRLMGVQNGNAGSDSILTIQNGVVKKIHWNLFSSADSTAAANGLTLSGKTVQLGGNLTQASTITSNSNTLTFATGGTALNITGLTAGAATDSIITINPATGRINRINASMLNKNDSTTASNGLTLSGKNILLGGNLTQASTITSNSNTLTFATGGTALNITGLTAGAVTDSIVTINPTSGRINRITPALLNKNDSTTASNGLTLSGKNILLGGNLTQASTITSNSNTLTFATGGTALNITGLTAGAVTDSLVTINPATGRINRINTSLLNKNDSTTASNGLTLSGNDVQLGGSLSQATSISTSASNTLSLLGVQNGTSTDSILVLGSGSVLKKVAQVAFPQLLVEAKRTTAYTPTSTYDTVVYNSASTNVGSAYSTTNGVFTAPATGLYEIIFNNSYALTSSSSTVVTMYASNRVYANGSIDMEKTNGAYKNANGIVVNTTLSGNTMVSLTSGQTVYLTAAGISSSGATAPALYGSGQHVLKIIRHQ